MPKNRWKGYFLWKRDGTMDQRTDGPTDQRTDTPSYRVASKRLKSYFLQKRHGPMDPWTNGPTDQQTNGPMDQQTDTPSYRVASTRLKTAQKCKKENLGVTDQIMKWLVKLQAHDWNKGNSQYGVPPLCVCMQVYVCKCMPSRWGRIYCLSIKLVTCYATYQ